MWFWYNSTERIKPRRIQVQENPNSKPLASVGNSCSLAAATRGQAVLLGLGSGHGGRQEQMHRGENKRFSSMGGQDEETSKPQCLRSDYGNRAHTII